MNNLTPMMKQYMEIKENTNDALVFYRLGDFYELFFEDAITAAKVLDLVLTQRSAGNNTKAPMCGVPHHAAKSYIQKLLANGYKVAIVEQVEDPKDAVGIVKREVVEIITPGTYIEDEDRETREIASIHQDLVYATIVSCDLVSGNVRALRIPNEPLEIIKSLQQFQVKELVVNSSFDAYEIESKTDIYVSIEDEIDKDTKHADSAIESALARLNQYLFYTHKRKLDHLSDVLVLNDESYLKMDFAAMSNLELIDHQKSKDLSLYHFLNRTQTNMGARALKTVLMQPLINENLILKRQDQIEYLINDFRLSDESVAQLKDTYDIHRVVARLASGKHNAQDFVRLKKSLQVFEMVQENFRAIGLFDFLSIDPLTSLMNSLEDTIYDDAPVALKEGRTFKPGLNKELDELMSLTKKGRQWLLAYEQKQKDITGIKNLKVGYNRSFGYYIEISKGQVENVKEEHGFIRKQTLTTGERYINQELQEYETKISQASESILKLESQLFVDYSEYVAGFSKGIHAVGEAIAYLDILLSLADVSKLPGYTRPVFNRESIIDIKAGKHPVLAQRLVDHQYIASDVLIDQDRKILILTGPNMGGKSTYMRMLALNVIMAQIGCFVPCDFANISIVDQIFTRMGSSDDILMGQSTFMVEMMEAQTALTRATKHSLILFDEIGRGTSTYDGMALAQAILEYIHMSVSCMSVFSTHYHELVALESMYPGMKNVHVEVYEENEKVTFLYRVVDGSAKQSYGINVARLAHLPKSLIDRASQNLQVLELSKSSVNIDNKIISVEVEPQHYSIVKDRLLRIDADKITPIESLMLLSELQEILRGDE